MVFSPILVMQTNTSMKVINSGQISPFGGLNFVLEAFDDLGIGTLLNKELPVLPKQSKYEWRDLLYSFWSVYFCGGDCIEDLSTNLKPSFSNSPLVKLCSADRLLERMKELSIPSEEFTAPRGKSRHEFSFNDTLNKLNVKILKKTLSGGLSKKPVVLDYDNTLIFTRKSDAKMTYKKEFGYAPGVGIIDDKVVYVENRNGNSDAQTLQQETLSRMFKVLDDEGIKIDVFRADSGSYQLTTILEASKHVDKFFIRARMSPLLNEAIGRIEDWKEIELDGETAYRGSTSFTPFKQAAQRIKYKEPLKSYRCVVTKTKRRDGQTNLFTGEAYNYGAIITNEHDLSNDQVVFFYNQRGKTEKEFDVLKNDFGWASLPFSKLEQNTVFLIFTAICKNLYSYTIGLFSKTFKGLKPQYRIKKFIFRFICVPAKWIKSSRYWKLRIYGGHAFKT